MNKTIAIIVTLVVALFTAVTVLGMLSGQIGSAGEVTDQQKQVGCKFQDQYADNPDQYSDKCVGRLNEKQQGSEIFDRAGVPVIG